MYERERSAGNKRAKKVTWGGRLVEMYYLSTNNREKGHLSKRWVKNLDPLVRGTGRNFEICKKVLRGGGGHTILDHKDVRRRGQQKTYGRSDNQVSTIFMVSEQKSQEERRPHGKSTANGKTKEIRITNTFGNSVGGMASNRGKIRSHERVRIGNHHS